MTAALSPNQVRDAFIQSIESGVPNLGYAAKLLRCPDILGAEACDRLEIRRGASIAQAARLVLERALAERKRLRANLGVSDAVSDDLCDLLSLTLQGVQPQEAAR
jgi:hypothetical protein